jgi:hypothetical protein
MRKFSLSLYSSFDINPKTLKTRTPLTKVISVCEERKSRQNSKEWLREGENNDDEMRWRREKENFRIK